MYATSWGHRHPHIFTSVRIAAATWNLALGVILLSRGYRWGAVLFVTSALIFCGAYIFARRNSESRAHGQN
jgi:hypothetical protein